MLALALFIFGVLTLHSLSSLLRAYAFFASYSCKTARWAHLGASAGATGFFAWQDHQHALIGTSVWVAAAISGVLALAVGRFCRKCSTCSPR